MRRYMTSLIMALSLISGCAPCSDYCEEQCLCDGEGEGGEANSSCVETCLETLEVYSPDVRDDECTERLTILQEECR